MGIDPAHVQTGLDDLGPTRGMHEQADELRDRLD